MSQPLVKGIQSQNVIANAKHWVLNNQETNRNTIDSIADTRTRFEMYYPPFEGAIAAGVGSIMCSYNKINGHWCVHILAPSLLSCWLWLARSLALVFKVVFPELGCDCA